MSHHTSNFHVGLAGAPAHHGSPLARRATCDPTTDLYTYPLGSTTVTQTSLTVTWDASCYPSLTNANIMLYAQGASGAQAIWPGIPFQNGQYTLTLKPEWWNATSTAELQLSIADPSQPAWLTQVPGPYFKVQLPASALSTTIVQGTATIVTAASGVLATSARSTSTDSIYQTVSIPRAAGLSKGAMAAAILVPLLVVGVAVAIYVRFARQREAEKRKRWSEHVDRRMSSMSMDWRAGGPPSVVAASRMSMASSVGGTGATAAGGARSTYYSTNGGPGMAGAGAGGAAAAATQRIPRVAAPRYHPDGTLDGRPTSQLRQSTIYGGMAPDDAASFAARQRASRVSFAENTTGAASGHRASRISFGGADLRPTQSHLGLNHPMYASGASNNGSRPSLNINRSTTTPPRHSIDNGDLQQHDDDNDVTAFSPSQAQGPFNVKSGGGLLSKISSAVGRKDKNHQGQSSASSSALERARSKEEAVDGWRQAEATRRSVEGIREMEAVMLRRSRVLSQYSAASTSPRMGGGNTNSFYAAGGAGAADENAVEELGDVPRISEPSNASLGAGGVIRPQLQQRSASNASSSSNGGSSSPMGMPMPPAGANPDDLLAAYASRAMSPTGERESEAPASLNAVNNTGNNPFRQSVVSDTSAYSTAKPAFDEEHETGVAK